MSEARRLRCVFFSLVSPEKGADVVLGAARRLPGVDFDFYGRLDKTFEHQFLAGVDSLDNVKYRGVFDSVEDDPVKELNGYDLHLFPSRWPNEGVPGVLVETKMAAVPSIVSDICYNSEIVRDGSEGIVLDNCTDAALAQAIESLDSDRVLLDSMKQAALESAERFYIDRYIGWLIADLLE